MADFHLLTRRLLRHYYTIAIAILFIIHATLGVSLSFNLDFSTSDYASELNYSIDAYWAKPVIQLTKDGKNNSVGRVWYARPVPLWDPTTRELASFDTDFSFQIIKTSSFHGDGMAFFLSHYPPVTPENSRGGGLGLFSRPSNSDEFKRNASGDEQFVAVEFDTFKNFWESSGDHVGIDINSIVSQASTDTGAGVDWPWAPRNNLSSGLPMSASVSYHNDTTLLSVNLQIDGTPYHVSTYVDLRDYMPPVVAVGFSAATGQCMELHQLLSWSFNSTDLEAAGKKPAATAAAAPAYPPQTTETTKGHSPDRLALAVVCGLLSLIILVMVAAFFYSKKISQWWQRQRERGSGQSSYRGPKRYQYCELVKATNGFQVRQKLGEGGSSEVYLGYDNDCQCQIAVKKLKILTGVDGGEEELRRSEFETEVKIISQVRHRNLVQLIGWCDSSNGLLLVYEFIAGGSLDKRLRRLAWKDRFQVIIHLANAICYLHEGHSDRTCVIHGDIKPSNIMLDEKLNAKLGDFGIARLVDHGVQPQTTKDAMGTPGYIEDEFAQTRKRCKKIDVYSFGIVLLEMVTDTPPTRPRFREEVWELYEQGRVAEATSERLRSESSDRQQQMVRVLVVGLWCTQQERGERPPIAEALRVLENDDSIFPDLRSPCQPPALSVICETPAHQHPNGEMALVPWQMYSNTAPVATIVGEQAYSSGMLTTAGARSTTQPSSTSYTTCSIGGAAVAESVGVD